MQVHQDISLQQHPDLSAMVAGKTPLLEATINGFATEATWELTGEQPRANLTLRLRDQTGRRGSTTFPAVYVKNEAELTTRLGNLKEALLKVEEWRKTVAEFFAKIRPWCEALPGNPVVREEPVRVLEAASGEYDITQLVVPLKGQELRIQPVAVWVLGFDGRVDLIGPYYDHAGLYYTRATDSWYHIPDDIPYRELPLTESLFRELVEACFDE